MNYMRLINDHEDIVLKIPIPEGNKKPKNADNYNSDGFGGQYVASEKTGISPVVMRVKSQQSPAGN
jgi:hypothetical protein